MADTTELFWPSLYSRLVPHRYGAEDDIPRAIRNARAFREATGHGLSEHRARQWIIVTNQTHVEARIAELEALRSAGDLDEEPADCLLRMMTEDVGSERLDAEEDDAPEHFLTDFRTLRHHIETDLISLLNATCLEAALNVGREAPVNERGDHVTLARDRFPLAAWPHVRRSVVNYGLPSMIGQSIYRLRVEDLEQELREAILAYEPRLNKLSVRVERRVVETGTGPEEMDDIDPEKPISFDIEAEVRGKGPPVQVLISTVWDLEKIESRARLVS